MSTFDQHAIDEVDDRGEASLATVFAAIESAGLQEASLGDAYLGRRGADVVAHLHGWHELFAGWCRAHLAGDPVHFPAEGYTWDDLRELNDAIFERHRGQGYDELKTLARASRREMFAWLRKVPGHDASTAGAMPWTTTSLVALADECAAIHDDWARERVHAALGAG